MRGFDNIHTSRETFLETKDHWTANIAIFCEDDVGVRTAHTCILYELRTIYAIKTIIDDTRSIFITTERASVATHSRCAACADGEGFYLNRVLVGLSHL